MPEGNTYKVYLTAEQWAKVAAHDDEIKSEIAKQQPELSALLEQQAPKTHEHHRGQRKGE